MKLVYAIATIIFAIVTLDMGISTINALFHLRIFAALFGALLTCGAGMLTRVCYKSI